MWSKYGVTEIQLEIGFIEERRTTSGNKEVPKPFSTIPIIRENTFYPFDSLLLATLHLAIL